MNLAKFKDFLADLQKTLEKARIEKGKRIGIREGKKLMERIKKAEEALPEAYEIARHLDKKENRKRLVRVLRKEGCKINEKDLEGIHLLYGQDELKRGLKRKYGLYAFPLLFVVPKEKWNSTKKIEGLDSKLGVKDRPVVCITVKYHPFKFLGGIIFISSEYIEEAKHEGLHQIEGIYFPGEKGIMDNLREELFGEMREAKKPADWLKMRDERWREWMGFYSPGMKKEKVKELEEKIKKSLQALAYLQLKTSPSVVAQTILHARNLQDIYSWGDTRIRKYKNNEEEKEIEKEFCKRAVKVYYSYGMKKEGIEKELCSYHLSLNKKERKKIIQEGYKKLKVKNGKNKSS